MRKLLFLLLFLLFCSEFVAQGRHGQQQNANVLRSFRVRASQEQLTAEQALSRFAGNIYRFSSEFPQEKVYLQFHNTSYYQGETIWFKAYVVEAATHHRAYHEPERYVSTNHGKYDMQDFMSVMLFDRVMTEREAMDLSPLKMEWHHKHGMYETPEELFAAERRRVVFIEIILEPGHQRPIRSELMHLNSRVTTVMGYSAPYEFYSPQYPDGPIPGDVDYRRTLYWNPNVITDDDDHASVEFYNNSYSTHLNVSGAGITTGGTPYVLDAEF